MLPSRSLAGPSVKENSPASFCSIAPGAMILLSAAFGWAAQNVAKKRAIKYLIRLSQIEAWLQVKHYSIRLQRHQPSSDIPQHVFLRQADRLLDLAHGQCSEWQRCSFWPCEADEKVEES